MTAIGLPLSAPEYPCACGAPERERDEHRCDWCDGCRVLASTHPGARDACECDWCECGERRCDGVCPCDGPQDDEWISAAYEAAGEAAEREREAIEIKRGRG